MRKEEILRVGTSEKGNVRCEWPIFVKKSRGNRSNELRKRRRKQQVFDAKRLEYESGDCEKGMHGNWGGGGGGGGGVE